MLLHLYVILARLQFGKYLSYCRFHENQVRCYFVRMFTSLDFEINVFSLPCLWCRRSVAAAVGDIKSSVKSNVRIDHLINKFS